MREHELILRGVAVLERMATRATAGRAVPAGDANAIIYFIRNFADGCHHAKEEGVLFPAMEAAGMPRQGGPIGVMLAEHDQGRAAVKTMADAVNLFEMSPDSQGVFARAAGAYASLLTSHIDKENTILFRMADRMIGPTQDDDLVRAYGVHEAQATDSDVHERSLKLVEQLETAYPATA
ncbi:MAG: hemerythrin domain-containing protein [Acidobacteriota bacterium]